MPNRTIISTSGLEVTVDIEDCMLINGDLVDASDHFTTENPATGEILAEVPIATEEHVDDAVRAAERACDRWQEISMADRRQKMEQFADLLRDRTDDILSLEVANNGSTVSKLRSDIKRGAHKFEYFGGLITEIKGDTNPVDGPQISFTKREPYGVVARTLPFNHPAMFTCDGIAAAIAAGNGIILKPSEYTPLSALYTGRLIVESDIFPEGLINVITGGSEVGKKLVEHPGVGIVSHTGGVPSGKKVMASAAKNITSVSMELGGKNPFIVFPDVAVEKAAKGAVGGMSLTWQGQSCQSGSRLLAHSEIYEDLVDRVVQGFSEMETGDPFDENASMGALVSKPHFERVMDYIETAKEEGANLLTGGEPIEETEGGYFIQPTIFEVEPDMTIAQEEIFGPVLSVIKWSDYDRMIEIANGVKYGLTGSVWTEDFSTAFRTADEIDAGIVWVNMHFGNPINAPAGGFKQSGGIGGKNHGIYELHNLTREKHILLNPDRDPSI